jgi:hypothetical protein
MRAYGTPSRLRSDISFIQRLRLSNAAVHTFVYNAEVLFVEQGVLYSLSFDHSWFDGTAPTQICILVAVYESQLVPGTNHSASLYADCDFPSRFL